MYEVLGFERAVCATLTGGEARVVTFAAEPLPRALAAGRLAGRGRQLGALRDSTGAVRPSATGVDFQGLEAACPYR